MTDDGSCPNLNAMHGHDVHVIAQEEDVAQTRNTFDNGEKRCQEVVVSANGVSFDGRKDAPIAEGVAHSQTIGTNPGFKDGVVVSMAQNTRDEVRIVGGDGQIAGALPAEPGMKQQTYIVSHGLDSYNNTLTGDCAPTISGAACDLHHTHGVISTNSNGEDVAPTLDQTTGSVRCTGAQSDKRGGYVVTRQEGAEGE